MTKDLTEQWKNGGLEVGEYYLRYKDGTIDREYYDYVRLYEMVTLKGFSTEDYEISEVLAPVPSYEEWQKTKEENRALATGSFPMMIEAAKKINQLKDIISKMCMELVDPDDDMSNGLADYFNQDLILEIHEVLK